MKQKVHYQKAFAAYVAILLLFLVVLDVFIYAWERRVLFENHEHELRNELLLIETFVIEPLILQQFGVVEQFIMRWGGKKTDVASIKAYTPQHVLLVHYQRKTPAPESLRFTHSVRYLDQHLLDLEMCQDLSPLTDHLNGFLNKLLLQSLAMAALIGCSLWFVLRLLALRPLEAEISKRIEAEQELQKSHESLERRVAERTASLKQSNESLERENAERVAAEKQLRLTNSTLETVLNSSLPISITNLNYEIMLANKAYYEIWPNPVATQAMVKCFDSRPGSLCDTDMCPLHRIINGAKEVIAEVVKDDASGERLDYLVTAKPCIDEDGTLIGVVESFQDITARKQMEHELASEKERLAVTLRSIGDGVITTDIDGKVVLMNRVGETLTGWSMDQAVGRPLEEVFQIIDEQSGEPCASPVAKVLATGQLVERAKYVRLVDRNGRGRSIADSGAPIRDVESRIIGVVLVFKDVTDRLRVEKEQLKMKKLESVGVLAGGIAHDFNNILAAILGNINLALLDEEMPPGSRELLKDAEKASLRARDLTQQLLTFSKGGEPIKRATSLAEVVKESANFVLRGLAVTCSYELPEDLWLVEIDTGQISQVVQNLVLNAAHAMPGGGSIEVVCENVELSDTKGLGRLLPGRYVKLRITDHGVGIPESIIDQIFDPYFSTKREGSGLGLAITNSIVSKHGGHIAVQSTPGSGSTFSIYLPATTMVAAVEAVAEEIIPQQSIAGRILVMDDDAMVRKVVNAMLTRLGHQVEFANDGETAVKLYQEALDGGAPFALVIMDLTIPGGMGGKEAVQQVLAIDPGARVVVSSGYSNDPVLANYQQHGFSAAIVKPYHLQDMKKLLSQFFS